MTQNPSSLLVLLPGLDGTGKLLMQFAAALSPGVECSIIPYPLNQQLGYDELEEIARALLPVNRDYILLGESFGGPLAIRLAAQQPQGLRGLILSASFASNPYPLLGWAHPFARLVPFKSLPRWIRAPFLWGSRTPSDAPTQFDRASAMVDESVLRHRIGQVLQVDVRDALRTIEVPILVLRALGDRLVPQASSDFILQHARRAHRVDIDGPHLLLQTRVPECAAAVASFIEGSYSLP
jgi:pimeloyl-[acyl-carrier protein] methyl ester esterase